MFKWRQKNFNKNMSTSKKFGIFSKLGLDKIGQGNRLRTTRTDTDFKTVSFEGKLKAMRARLVGKHQLAHFSDENIARTKDIIEPILKKRVSKKKASLSRIEAKEANVAFYNLYKNDKTFSRQDYLTAKKIVGVLRNSKKSFLLRNEIKTDNTISEENNLSGKVTTEKNINRVTNNLNTKSYINPKIELTALDKVHPVEPDEKIDIKDEIDKEFDLETPILQKQNLAENKETEESGGEVKDLPI